MKKQLLFKDDFERYLIDKELFEVNSAKSYSSYVTSALRDRTICIDTDTFFDIIETNKEHHKIKFLIKFIDNVLVFYHKENIEKEIEVPQKTISNWKSGLKKYRDYLECKLLDLEQDFTNTIESIHAGDSPSIELLQFKSANSIPQGSSSVAIYSKKELIDIFIFRILTQDRCYDHICFPIRLIKRILYKCGQRKAFDAIILKAINEIEVHVGSGKVLILKDIDELRIDGRSKHTTVVSGGVTHDVYTPIHNGKNTLMRVGSISQISIDHKIPMYDIMTGLIGKLPNIGKLCNTMRAMAGGNLSTSKMRDLYDDILEDSNICDKAFVAGLLRELEIIFDKMDLQLMDLSHNSSKGKK